MAQLYFQTNVSVNGINILIPSEEIPIRIDIQTIDNSEIGQIYGDTTQPFNIASSPDSDLFFKHAFDNNGQVVPGTFQSIVGSLNSEERTIFQEATLVLEGWDEASGDYQCTMTAGLVTLNELMKDLLISGEDQTWDSINPNPWDAYDHVYSMAGEGGWLDQNTTTSADDLPDYYYPFIDHGWDSEGRTKIPNPVYSANTDYTGGQDSSALYATQYGAINVLNDSIGTNYGQQQLPQYKFTQSTPFFGDVSRVRGGGKLVQGNIDHPSTPMRIDQFKPAVKLTTLIDVVFKLLNQKNARKTPDQQFNYQAIYYTDIPTGSDIQSVLETADEGYIAYSNSQYTNVVFSDNTNGGVDFDFDETAFDSTFGGPPSTVGTSFSFIAAAPSKLQSIDEINWNNVAIGNTIDLNYGATSNLAGRFISLTVDNLIYHQKSGFEIAYIEATILSSESFGGALQGKSSFSIPAQSTTPATFSYDISTWSDDLEDVYVMPNEIEGLGIIHDGVLSPYGGSVNQVVSETNT